MAASLYRGGPTCSAEIMPCSEEHGTLITELKEAAETQCTLTIIGFDGMPLVTATSVLMPVSAPARTSKWVYCTLVLWTA